ncbi:MAG: hypothetical protein AAB432_01705 [Patescibacteria group bacterium]
MQTGKSWVKVLIVLVVVVVLGALYYFKVIPQVFTSNNVYQAVFLSNGQVYFGNLSREASQFVVLNDVFYLQITQAPQPLKAGETPPTNINIVKLGGELHGPTDEMRINRDQVLFIENLKTDSRVTQAIDQFKKANP